MHTYAWNEPLTSRFSSKRNRQKNKLVDFRNFAQFMDCINETNATQVGNSKEMDVVMSTFNMIDYSHNYSRMHGSLWKYYRKKQNATIAK